MLNDLFSSGKLILHSPLCINVPKEGLGFCALMSRKKGLAFADHLKQVNWEVTSLNNKASRFTNGNSREFKLNTNFILVLMSSKSKDCSHHPNWGLRNFKIIFINLKCTDPLMKAIFECWNQPLGQETRLEFYKAAVKNIFFPYDKLLKSWLCQGW